MSRPIYSVIADPESLRWEAYHRDLQTFWKARNVEPDLHVVSWLDVIASHGNLDTTLGQMSVLDEPSHYVRIESPARGTEMMRAMLTAGRCLESGSFQSQVDPASKSFARGELVSPGQLYRGFQTVLSGMDTWLKTHRFAGQISACPLSIAEMFDKNATSERLDSESIAVPDRLPFESDLDRSRLELGRELLNEIRRSGMQGVYVKLAHGSSASGMIYLDCRGAKTRNLSTMVLLDASFFNTRNIQSLEGDHLLRALGFLVQNGVCVQREVRKALIGGESFDLRVIVINGRVEFTIFRLSESPFTNLHLGGRRGDWDSCRAAIPQRAWLDAMDDCLRAASLYHTDRVGVDLAFERDFRGHSILELNPFGDFFPDWKNEQGQTVHSRIIQSNAEKMGWDPSA